MRVSFDFLPQADPPDWTRIPQDDLLGVTVLLLTCAYNGAEFIRVGYYVNNEYADEALRDNPPATVQVDRVVRNILADKPRVTRYNIDYGVPVATVTPAISDGGMGGNAMADQMMHEYSPEAMYPTAGAGQGGMMMEAAAAGGGMMGAY